MHGNEKPDTWVDISETLELKIQALKKHFSQSDTHDAERDDPRMGRRRKARPGACRYAEAFRVMMLHRDEDSPRE